MADPDLASFVPDLDDTEEVVFLQTWDEPTRRHAPTKKWGADRRRRNWWIAATVGTFTLVSGAGLMAVAADGRGMIPKELQGVWRTENNRYVDAALGLQAHEIAFYNGQGVPDQYRIELVTTRPVDDKVRYTVDYLVEEQGYTISFLATRDVRPSIQLVSRPRMIWRRGDVRFAPKANGEQAVASTETAAPELTPISPAFVACIKAASRARAAGQAPVRCTQPEREQRQAVVAAAPRDSISLMEDLGARRRPSR